MENQEFQFDRQFSEDEPLTLPHFDEEATIQSARPVVPLRDVRKSTRRSWLSVLAVILAAALGVVAASLIYSSRKEQAQDLTGAKQTFPAKSPDFVAPSGEAGGATLNRDQSVALEGEPTTEISVEKTDLRQPTPIKRAARRAPVEKVEQESKPEAQTEDREHEDFPAEDQSRRQQRREARQLMRQRRVEERRGNDLTRIREIFVGSRRP